MRGPENAKRDVVDAEPEAEAAQGRHSGFPDVNVFAGGHGRLAMPDPKSLKVGDLVRFVALPDEWSRTGYTVHRESIAFMKMMVSRTWPSRVVEIDEYGCPWIHARIRVRGRLHYHSWGIMESTGWRVVRRC